MVDEGVFRGHDSKFFVGENDSHSFGEIIMNMAIPNIIVL